MKVSRRALGLALFGLVLSACGSGATEGKGGASGETYKIGINDDFSGPIAFAGIPLEAGFRTYIDYVNKEKGGVNGRQIELKTLDNRADAAVGLSNYQELVRDFGAIATVGYSSSLVWASTGAAAERSKVAQIGHSGTNQLGDGTPPKYLFSVTQTQEIGMQAQFEFLDQLASKEPQTNPKVGIISINSASGPEFNALVDDFAAERGWKVLDPQGVDFAASDCAAQASAIAAEDPTFIVSNMTNSGEDIVCMKALRAKGWDGPVVNSSYNPVEKTYETLADPNWYSERLTVWAEDKTEPGAVTLLKRAVKYGHDDKIDHDFSLGYVMGMLIEAALEKCGAKCDAEAFAGALESVGKIDTQGIAGPNFGYTDGKYGHTASVENKIFQWDPKLKQSVAVTDWICGVKARC